MPSLPPVESAAGPTAGTWVLVPVVGSWRQRPGVRGREAGLLRTGWPSNDDILPRPRCCSRHTHRPSQNRCFPTTTRGPSACGPRLPVAHLFCRQVLGYGFLMYCNAAAACSLPYGRAGCAHGRGHPVQRMLTLEQAPGHAGGAPVRGTPSRLQQGAVQTPVPAHRTRRSNHKHQMPIARPTAHHSRDKITFYTMYLLWILSSQWSF